MSPDADLFQQAGVHACQPTADSNTAHDPAPLSTHFWFDQAQSLKQPVEINAPFFALKTLQGGVQETMTKHLRVLYASTVLSCPTLNVVVITSSTMLAR